MQADKDGRCRNSADTSTCPEGQEKNQNGNCVVPGEGGEEDGGSETAGGCLENEVEQPDGECVCSEGTQRNNDGQCVASGAGEEETEEDVAENDDDSKPNPIGSPLDADPGVYYGQGMKDLVGLPSGQGEHVIDSEHAREAMREGMMERARQKMDERIQYTPEMGSPGGQDVAAPPLEDDKCQFAEGCGDGTPDAR
jgi:hypothetical protein